MRNHAPAPRELQGPAQGFYARLLVRSVRFMVFGESLRLGVHAHHRARVAGVRRVQHSCASIGGGTFTVTVTLAVTFIAIVTVTVTLTVTVTVTPTVTFTVTVTLTVTVVIPG